MPFIQQIHSSFVVPYVFRPENSWYFKLKFVQEDMTTVFDMSIYDLYLSIDKSNLVPKFLITPDGTNEPNRIVCQRRERKGQVVNGVALDLEEDGIYLKDEDTQEFWVQYSKPLNEAFEKGKYIANLWAVTEHGIRWNLLTFDIEVTNEDRYASNATQLGEVITVPVQKIDTSLIIVPLKLIPK